MILVRFFDMGITLVFCVHLVCMTVTDVGFLVGLGMSAQGRFGRWKSTSFRRSWRTPEGWRQQYDAGN